MVIGKKMSHTNSSESDNQHNSSKSTSRFSSGSFDENKDVSIIPLLNNPSSLIETATNAIPATAFTEENHLGGVGMVQPGGG